MCEFHESNGNGFRDMWWTDKCTYFSSIGIHIEGKIRPRMFTTPDLQINHNKHSILDILHLTFSFNLFLVLGCCCLVNGWANHKVQNPK